MKISHLVTGTALLIAAQSSWSLNDDSQARQELRQELDSLFLQEKIHSVTDSDLSIHANLGESWIKYSKVHELNVIQDGIKHLGGLMLETYVVENSPVLITNLSDEITEGKQEYRILRDAHPKAHQCVSAEFNVEDNAFFPSNSFLGDEDNHEAVIRFSTAAATPNSDVEKGTRGAAVKVKLGDRTHDFVMITSPILPVDNAEQFINAVKVARLANCVSVIPDNQTSESLLDSLNNIEQRTAALAQCVRDAEISILDIPDILLSLKRINDLSNASVVASVFDQPYFGISPYAFNNNVFKFEMSPTRCADENSEDQSLTEEEATQERGLENNIKRVLTSGTVCYDLNVIARPASLSNRQAIETHTKTWDDMSNSTLERIKVASVIVSQSQPNSDISALDCDNMAFSPLHTAGGFITLGSINRARAIVYQKLSEFRVEINDYLRGQ